MPDEGLVGLDDLFCFLKRVELPLEGSAVQRFNPLDLAGIEDARVSENGSLQAIGVLHFLMSIRILFCFGGSTREIADGLSMFAATYAPSLVRALQKGHPARVLIALAHRGDAEVDGVKPSVDGMGDRIVRSIWDASCLPGTDPRSGALLETLDDPLRHFFRIRETGGA